MQAKLIIESKPPEHCEVADIRGEMTQGTGYSIADLYLLAVMGMIKDRPDELVKRMQLSAEDIQSKSDENYQPNTENQTMN